MPTPAETSFSILIVAEIDARTSLKAHLEKSRTSSRRTASDGEEALGKLKRTSFDLVFLDYRLPPSDGLEILDKIRQHHPKTAVVMTTAAGSEQLAVAAMKMGAMDYLTRQDLRQADLGQLLRRVIEIRDLVNQNMELRQVNQMKNEFIANVSHESDPFDGRHRLCEHDWTGPRPSTRPRPHCRGRALRRPDGVLNNILSASARSRAQGPSSSPVDLRALWNPRSSAGKEMRRKKPADRPLGAAPAWVLADEEKLGVIDNLLSNAAFSLAGTLRWS